MAVQETQETWQSVVEATTWLKVTQRDGSEREVSLSRKGQKIHLTAEDRMRMQELLVDDVFDPFKNGALIQLGSDGVPVASDNGSQSDEWLLTEVLTMRGEELKQRLENFGEVVLRRLLDLAEQADMPNSVVAAVREIVTRRYSVGKQSKVYQEMQAAGDVSTTRLR
jgi:hypothetical protein